MGIFKTDGKAILIGFIGLIIAVVLLSPIADSVFGQTNTVTVANGTYTAAAFGANVTLPGRDLVGTAAVWNGSNVVEATNITVSAGVVNGIRTVTMETLDVNFSSVPVNVSYVYNPDGYLPLGSSRAIAGLIVLFSSLAALVFIIVTFIKEGSMGNIIRGR